MIHRSPHQDIAVPETSLAEHVLRDARGRGDKVALIDASTGESLTYRNLADAVDMMAAGLAYEGIGPGDVVALLSHNQPWYAVAVHAVLKAGATVTPINPAGTIPEVAKQLTAARACAIIASSQAAEPASIAAGLAAIDRRYVLGLAVGGFAAFSDLARPADRAPDLGLDLSTALAVLPFSSGTTGLPKGVCLTHRNLVANLEQNSVGWPVASHDVLAAALPFFHIYGLTVILNAGLRAGATLVTLPRYDRGAFLSMIQEHSVTRVFLAPPMVLDLATSPDVPTYDLSSLTAAVCGAAPLDVGVASRAEKRLGVRIRQGYGMTEASPGTHLVSDALANTTPSGSVGYLVASTEARLIDPGSGEDVALGEPGELWVRGPQVMAGYLDDDASTATTIVENGWLRTGDIVRVDENGVFWVTDRLKELIKYKGFQVAPAELEALLLTHPAVLDAAVVGVPHREGGEAPKAFVVVSEWLDPVDLMTWVAGQVASYKKIREVEFIEAIPKSPTGKILRRLLT